MEKNKIHLKIVLRAGENYGKPIIHKNIKWWTTTSSNLLSIMLSNGKRRYYSLYNISYFEPTEDY